MKLPALTLLLLLSISASISLLSADAERCTRIDVPAVESQGGKGSVVGMTICLVPGTDGLRIYGVDKIETDTLISIIAAFIIAQLFSNQTHAGYGLDVSFEKYVEDVSGPSAGALITLAIYSLLSGNSHQGLSGTGAINLDGSVEAVGGIAQKLSALRASGYREVFLPVVNSIQYGRLYNDLKVIPVSVISDLLNASPPTISLEAGEERVIDVISSVSKNHLAFMKNILENLLKIYMDRVHDTRSAEHRLIASMLSIVNKSSLDAGYASVNMYYLLTIYVVQAIVNNDLDGYGRILIQKAVSEYNRSVGRLAAAFSNIPRSMDVDRFLLYLILFDRAVDLASYDDLVSAYLGNGDIGSIAPVAGTLYGRILSIEYWLDVLGNMTSGSRGIVDLDEIYSRSRSLLSVIGVSSISDGYVRNITRIMGSKADLDGLRILNTAYVLYSYLQNYSSTVRSSTLSQATPLTGIRPDPSILDQLRRSGYMTKTTGIMSSGVARSIYNFSLWVLRSLDPQSQEARILTLSLISTSSSAASLNMIYLIFSKKVYVPTKLELKGESSNIFQGSAGGSSANVPRIDLDALSRALALASISLSIIMLIYVYLHTSRRDSTGYG